MNRVFAYFINRPIPANMLLVLILGLAVIAVSNLQRLAYPRADFERVNVYTLYPGAVPAVVERTITTPLEKALMGVAGIRRMTSRSTDHVSLISLVLEPGKGQREKIKADIRKAVSGVRDLPAGSSPRVIDIEIDNFHVFEAALIVPNNDPELLHKHARALRTKLLTVRGVSQVHDFGLPKPEIRVIMDKRRLARRGVSVSRVAFALKKYTGIYGVGGIQREDRRLGLILDAGRHRAKSIEDLTVPSLAAHMRGGRPPRIRDLGRVEKGYHRSGVEFRFNGSTGASLLILKQGRADLIRVVERVRDAIDEYKKTAPDLRVEYVVDESVPVRNRLFITLSNALLGFILVLLVLFLFLDPRVAFWTAAGIPIALACAVVLLPILNVTLDTVSLIGMITVMGMVVDDAIIVSESIYRARERGLPGREAALEGLKAVVRPIFITILTTIIAFAPIFLIPGVVGDFARAIPIVVIVMLIASFLEATFILPGHLAGAGERVPRSPPGARMIAFLRGHYISALKTLLPRRTMGLALAGLLLACMGVLGYQITNFNLMPADEAVNMWILGETPAGSSAEYTARETRKIETLIKRLPPGTVHFARTVSGFDLDGFLEAPNHFSIRLRLTPPDQREWNAPRIKAFLLAEMKAANFKNFRNLECFILGAGPPLGRPVELTVSGGDDAGRLRIAEKMLKRLKGLHARTPVMDRRAGRETLVLKMNQARAARSLITPEDLALTLRAATRGVRVQGREGDTDLRLLISGAGGGGSDPLAGLTVANPVGRVYSAASLAKISRETSLKSIYHFDGRPSITIRAGIDQERTGALRVYRRLGEMFVNFSAENPGYYLHIGGEGRENADLFGDIVPLFLITLLVIYGFLAIQFNSLVQPFMVIAPVPFGLAGIALVLGLHGMDLSLMALCGALGFLGVVVNDSVILVHRINRCIRDGEENPIIAAADQRFRAILLTTLTTVAGLLPTAYGIFGGLDGFISPLVLSMAWGLLVGTTSVLFFVPLVYSFYIERVRRTS